MKISIIIPTYKRNEHIERAIESVLNQKGNFELIVVDDNDSNSIYRKKNIENLKKYEKYKNFIYVKHEKNKNGAAARNTGIKIAQGDYITFLDDDDEFEEKRIEKIESVILKSDVDFLCSGVYLKKDGILIQKKMPGLDKNINELIYELLNQKSFIITGSNMVCKTEIVKLISGFDENFSRYQDMEFLIRYLEKSKTVYLIEEYLVSKNIDDDSNVPQIDKLISINEQFLNKFKQQIQNSSSEKTILSNNYYKLLALSIIYKDKLSYKKAIKLIKERKIFNIFSIVRTHLKIYIKNNNIVKIIRRKTLR